MKRLFKVILDLIIVLFVIAAAVETTMILMKDENGVPHFGDYIPVSIKDDTMEPTIMTNDLIIDKKVATKESIKENDVISYFVEKNGKKELKTGRVIEVNQNNGSTFWKVRGDNQGEAEEEIVESANVVGLFTNTKMLIVGGVLTFLESQNGFLICIILPLVFLFFYQVCKLIGTILKEKKEKEEENPPEIEEKIDLESSQQLEPKTPVEIPKEAPIKIETPKIETPQNEMDNSELDIPIVVTEPSFATPNIDSIPIPDIPNNNDINRIDHQENIPKEQEITEKKKKLPSEEEEIEIL